MSWIIYALNQRKKKAEIDIGDSEASEKEAERWLMISLGISINIPP